MENYYCGQANIAALKALKTLNLELIQIRSLKKTGLYGHKRKAQRIASEHSSVFQKIKSENWCTNGYK